VYRVTQVHNQWWEDLSFGLRHAGLKIRLMSVYVPKNSYCMSSIFSPFSGTEKITQLAVTLNLFSVIDL
jgi:hypothetical protein